MRIILEINDTHIPNSKQIEMHTFDGEVRKSLREIISTSSELLSKEQIKAALATRLTQLLHIEIENYVNSKFE